MLALLCAAWLPGAAWAGELLTNGSFESPTAPANGNNFYTTISNWTIVSTNSPQPNPFNLVRPYSGYCCNQVLTTPSGGGSQYLDIFGGSAQIRHSFTLAQAGTVQASGWFSSRDNARTLTGNTVFIKTTSGVTLTSATVNFASNEPVGSWKQAVTLNVWLSAGTYYFEAFVDDFANIDLASVQLLTPNSLGTSETMASCPVTPQTVAGSLAGWNFSAPANTLTQDGYYDSSATLKEWNSTGVGADLTRLGGQGGNVSFGTGLAAAISSSVSNLKPTNGTWSLTVPTLAAAISTGSYAQMSFTTASTYEASRLVLNSAFNYNTPSGTYQQAAYISTSPTFTTYTELFHDQPVSSTAPIFATKPLLAPGTTYYIRIYFYNVTATSNADGTVIWDAWNAGGGICSSLNPATDSGSAISGTPKTIIANIAANDKVNGWSAVLGSGGNATISTQGTWPTGVLLNSATAALSIDANSTAGTYSLTYRLCDLAPTPVCADSTIALTLAQHLTVSKTSAVLSDPVNGSVNPKAIPGAVIRYCIIVSNPAGNPAATDVSLSDVLPASSLTFQAGSLKVNDALTGADCDYTTGTAIGSESEDVITATLPDIAGGGFVGVYYTAVVVQ